MVNYVIMLFICHDVILNAIGFDGEKYVQVLHNLQNRFCVQVLMGSIHFDSAFYVVQRSKLRKMPE